MKSIAGLGRSGASLIDADRSPTDEIAFVVDSRALSLMEVGNTLSQHGIMMQIPEAHRIGAPIGWYDISDLDTLPPRRMYVFLNLFDPTAKDLENIARLKSDGRVLIFIYGAGVYNRGLFSPKASERLIGFPLMHRAQERSAFREGGRRRVPPHRRLGVCEGCEDARLFCAGTNRRKSAGYIDGWRARTGPE